MRSLLLSAIVLSSALLMACEEGPKPPLKTAASTPGAGAGAGAAAAQASWMTPRGVAKGDTATATAGSIQIDERILKACGDLPEAHFPFDSAAISGEAANMLEALAKCFVSGPLAGARMHLVGHADPRGGIAYNLALGHQRAGSVAAFLSNHGLEESRIGAVSRGDFEASGTDEEGWALDRKVEVYLAN